MSIQFHQMTFNEYTTERYNAILRVEEKGGVEALTPYNDGIGLVTIGVGYNLSDTNVRSRVLEALGITDPLKIKDLNDYLSIKHDGVSDEQIQADLAAPEILGKPFEFESANQVKLVFDGLCRIDGLAQTYEDKVDAFALGIGIGVRLDKWALARKIHKAWHVKKDSTIPAPAIMSFFGAMPDKISSLMRGTEVASSFFSRKVLKDSGIVSMLTA